MDDFNQFRIFLTDFGEIFEHKIYSKYFYWEPRCSMRKDRQTDRYDEAKSRLPQA